MCFKKDRNLNINMSEEVETTPAPPAEILPAKSEDKLIIEKEEQESEQEEKKAEEPAEEKTEEKPEEKPEEQKEENKEPDNEGEEKPDKVEEVKEEKEVEADNKESNKESPEEDKEDDEKEGDEDGKEVRARKKFKMPKVELKAPKVPDFIRSLSKERKKVSHLKAFLYQCTKIKL